MYTNASTAEHNGGVLTPTIATLTTACLGAIESTLPSYSVVSTALAQISGSHTWRLVTTNESRLRPIWPTFPFDVNYLPPIDDNVILQMPDVPRFRLGTATSARLREVFVSEGGLNAPNVGIDYKSALIDCPEN